MNLPFESDSVDASARSRPSFVPSCPSFFVLRFSYASTARYGTQAGTYTNALHHHPHCHPRPPQSNPSMTVQVRTEASQLQHPGTSWLRGIDSFSDPPLARTALSLVSRRAGSKPRSGNPCTPGPIFHPIPVLPIWAQLSPFLSSFGEIRRPRPRPSPNSNSNEPRPREEKSDGKKTKHRKRTQKLT